jgi:hypothetical protein
MANAQISTPVGAFARCRCGGLHLPPSASKESPRKTLLRPLRREMRGALIFFSECGNDLPGWEL